MGCLLLLLPLPIQSDLHLVVRGLLSPWDFTEYVTVQLISQLDYLPSRCAFSPN
jgi:hypothetical protein